MLSKRLWVRRSVVGVAGMAAVVLAACGSTTGSSGPAVTKTSATFAEGPGAQPNYIFPLTSLGLFQCRQPQPVPVPDEPAAALVRRQRSGSQLNSSLSLADQNVDAADGKQVTITLKGWKWSDGTQITARDIQFWQNLVTANKENWAGYSPGEYPDNVLSTTINPNNPLQITFNLSQAYGSYFFTYNELSQITPLPQHVWDKEWATGPVGNYDRPQPARRRSTSSWTRSRSPSRPMTPTRSGRSCRVRGS